MCASFVWNKTEQLSAHRIQVGSPQPKMRGTLPKVRGRAQGQAVILCAPSEVSYRCHVASAELECGVSEDLSQKRVGTKMVIQNVQGESTNRSGWQGKLSGDEDAHLNGVRGVPLDTSDWEGGVPLPVRFKIHKGTFCEVAVDESLVSIIKNDDHAPFFRRGQ